MVDNCQWVAWIDASGKPCCRSVCCGYVMDQTDPAKCFAQCRKKPRPAVAVCRHQLHHVGEILVDCESCQGRVRIKQVVHACAAFGDSGRCLPSFVPADLKAWEARKPESDIYHLCHGCVLFSPA